jgi:pyruvate dehydrogenase E2 component (dihydrolipoamide acetyltransferase)
MMATTVVMPKLGLTMREGTIVNWLKNEGEPVEKGKPLLEIETEKVTTEVDAPASGILSKILAPRGSTVPVSETIAFISEPGEAPSLSSIEPTNSFEKPAERTRISPLAKKLADKHEIDVTKIKGTGPSGRIVRDDVLKAVETAKSTLITRPPSEEVKVVPLTTMRENIGQRMLQSTLTAAHVTITTEVDASEAIKVRQNLLPKMEKITGVRLSYTDILVKVVAKALREYPIVNSTLEDKSLKLLERVNIGVAVSLEQGLIVPVIHDADRKSIVEISTSLSELVDKARQNKLSLDEVTGGTFTVSNLGMYGVDVFTPIINPPENAILGVGRIADKPVVLNGQIVARPVVVLSLSFDHRVMDGAQAASFLQRIKQIVETLSIADVDDNKIT